MPEALEFPSSRVDVVGSLRRLADRIDAGGYGEVRFAIAAIIADGDKMASFAWGACSDLEAAGAFAQAAHYAVHCLNELNEPATDDGAP